MDEIQKLKVACNYAESAGTGFELKAHDLRRLLDEVMRLQASLVEMEHRAIAAETAHESANALLVKAEMKDERLDGALEEMARLTNEWGADLTIGILQRNRWRKLSKIATDALKGGE